MSALTPLQRLCLEHYCEGEFKDLTTMDQVQEAGDGLLTFLMLEAADIGRQDEMVGALDKAASELRYVLWQLQEDV